MRHLIYAHGLGETSKSEGILKYIAKSFKDEENAFLDLNIPNFETGEITLNPISKQAKVISEYLESYDKKENILIAHSMGCAATARADLSNLSHVILLAPPYHFEVDKIISRYEDRGDEVDMDGESRLSKSNGTTAVVGSEFWKEAQNQDDLAERYEDIGKQQNLLIITAKEDELIPWRDLSEEIPHAEVVSLHANHNFEGGVSEEVVNAIKEFVN